jgi:hypothetical protein
MLLLSVLVAGCIVAPQQGDVSASMAMLERVRAVASEGRFDSLEKLFAQPRYADSIRQLASDGQALRQLKVDAFPAPKGLEKFGDYWLIFHRHQGLESEHDRIHPIVRTGDGLALGPEVAEDIAIPYEITHQDFKIVLGESEPVVVEATIDLKRTSGDGAVLMRMNDTYQVGAATYNDKSIKVYTNDSLSKITLDASKSELIQAGGVIILTNPGTKGKLRLLYPGNFRHRGGDLATQESVILTSYWYPHIGRSPSTSSATVTGPKDWLILTNGDIASETISGEKKTVSFVNKVPIPYFHLVAGPYRLAAEVKDRGRAIRAWHLDDRDTSRAKSDVESAKNAIAFFEDRYGSYPYNHYDIVDTPDYYGIECYSFTLLSPSISSWATSHEVGPAASHAT